MNTLKEQDGRYYQECEVVMLATEYGKITLYDYANLNTLSLAQGNHKGIKHIIVPHHLYITSNEKIKELDWYVDDCNRVRQSIISDKDYWDKRPDYKKIIATTDESLKIDNDITDQTSAIWNKTDIKTVIVGSKSLPKPSDSFISKYIEEYNKGNIITKVLVEYEFNQHKFMATLCTTKEKEYNLKVNSDNTITIKKVKDSYSREEVFILLNELSAYLEKEGACNSYPTQVLHEITQTFIKNNI